MEPRREKPDTATAPAPEQPQSDDRETKERPKRWLEILSVVVLSLAGVATSWSTYQSARWSGVQATNFAQAGALRVESARASAQADQLAAIDVELFTSWLNAYAAEDEELQEFYRTRFRDEFRPAFEAWVASRPLQNPDALRSPFQQPEYQLADRREANLLQSEAEAKFQTARNANQQSDDYVLNAVIFAIALFFAGLGQVPRLLFAKAALTGLGAFLLLFGLYHVATFPVH